MSAPSLSEGVPALVASDRLNEWRRGWRVVLAAAIGYGTGGAMIILLSGLFIKPMRDELGWSTAAVTIMPIVTLVWAFCNPFTGAVIDRAGSRRVGIVGMVGLAICTAFLGALPVTAGVLYGLAAVMGVFASMTSVATYSRGVASWYSRDLGLALGVALSGSAAVAAVATPLIGLIIAEYGWRSGFYSLSATVLVLALPVVALLYRERGSVGAATGPEMEEPTGAGVVDAIRDLRFWCYAGSFTLACIAVSGTATHLQPLLADKSFPLEQALALGVIYALSISAGKILGGLLLDRIWPFVVVFAITVVASAGALGLAYAQSTTAFPLMVLAVGAVGAAAGAEADFVGYFGLRSFGMRKFSTIVGILALIVTFGNAVGSWLYGVLFDYYGSYEVASVMAPTHFGERRRRSSTGRRATCAPSRSFSVIARSRMRGFRHWQ